MLQERLRNAWHARERAIAISPVLTLAPEGLVLGAGTVMVLADGSHCLKSLEGQEARGDQRGQVVGRVLPGGSIAIDPAAIFPEAANDNNPKLCPEMGPDKPGERGRDYADYVKRVVNPPPDIPTPRYWGYQLPNPYDFGKLVYYDDCQHATGMMVEAKGPGYAGHLRYEILKDSVSQEWLAESGRQVDASQGRPIRWYFAELGVALFAGDIFRTADKGRENIKIVWLPWRATKK